MTTVTPASRETLLSTDPAAADHALRVVVEERIRTLLRYRLWWRQNRWADWPAERSATIAELRALVRLVREARRVARAATPGLWSDGSVPWQDRAADYHAWQAAEAVPPRRLTGWEPVPDESEAERSWQRWERVSGL